MKFTLLHKISVLLVIITFVAFCAYNIRYQKQIPLDDIVKASLAAATIPYGFCLVSHIFFPKLISVEDMPIQIALGGLVLLYVCVKTVLSSFAGS